MNHLKTVISNNIVNIMNINMRYSIYIVLLFAILCFSKAQDYRNIDSIANDIAQKAYTEIDLYGKLKGTDRPREYVTHAYYDSISVKTKSDFFRLYFMVLDYVKLDSLMIMFTSLPDYYCIVSSSGQYYLIESEEAFGEVVKSLQPLDTPAKAEFLGIVYAKCVKGVSNYSVKDTNCSISTVFRKNEFITTI